MIRPFRSRRERENDPLAERSRLQPDQPEWWRGTARRERTKWWREITQREWWAARWDAGRKKLPQSKSGWIFGIAYVLVAWAATWVNNHGIGLLTTRFFKHDRCAVSLVEPSSWTDALIEPSLRWIAKERVPSKVVVVTLQPKVEPDPAMNNFCRGREFMTHLVRDLNRLGAGVIAIDKFYSPESCAEETVNRDFKEALAGSKVPVVVGQETDELSSVSRNGDCLIKDETFFSHTKVKQGLSRLNGDSQRIPLSWWAFSSDKEALQNDNAADQTEGFALTAAKTADPELGGKRAEIDRLEQRFEHPYASLLTFPYSLNAFDVVCAVEGQKVMDQMQGRTCGNDAETTQAALQTAIKGRLIVVGELDQADRHTTAGGEQYGTYLQASYAENLLEGHIVEDAAWWWQWALCAPLMFAVNQANSKKPKAAWPVGLALAAAILVFAVWFWLLRAEVYTAVFLLNVGILCYYVVGGVLRLGKQMLRRQEV